MWFWCRHPDNKMGRIIPETLCGKVVIPLKDKPIEVFARFAFNSPPHPCHCGPAVEEVVTAKLVHRHGHQMKYGIELEWRIRGRREIEWLAYYGK